MGPAIKNILQFAVKMLQNVWVYCMTLGEFQAFMSLDRWLAWQWHKAKLITAQHKSYFITCTILEELHNYHGYVKVMQKLSDLQWLKVQVIMRLYSYISGSQVVLTLLFDTGYVAGIIGTTLWTWWVNYSYISINVMLVDRWEVLLYYYYLDQLRMENTLREWKRTIWAIPSFSTFQYIFIANACCLCSSILVITLSQSRKLGKEGMYWNFQTTLGVYGLWP